MSVNSNRFCLCKRCNQTYYIGYYLNGRRKWKSTGASVKAEALKALTHFKELFQARAGSVSLEQFNTQFLAYGEANYSPKTLIPYRAILTRFLSAVRNISLRELNPQHIDSYKSERLKAVKVRGKQESQQKVSPTSVNVELRMLKAAFNTARRWKLLDSNPFDGVRLAEVPEREPLFFSQIDFEKLVACTKENWLKEIVLFAVLTGMRRGELINLRWEDVDLQTKTIQIHSTAKFKTKQGRKRAIPLNDTAFYLLQSKRGKDTSEFVFTLNGMQVFDGWLTHAFKKAVTRARLEKGRLHFHSLRHYAESRTMPSGDANSSRLNPFPFVNSA